MSDPADEVRSGVLLTDMDSPFMRPESGSPGEGVVLGGSADDPAVISEDVTVAPCASFEASFCPSFGVGDMAPPFSGANSVPIKVTWRPAGFPSL